MRMVIPNKIFLVVSIYKNQKELGFKENKKEKYKK